MRPPAYFEPPPSYDEDAENERRRLREAEENERRKLQEAEENERRRLREAEENERRRLKEEAAKKRKEEARNKQQNRTNRDVEKGNMRRKRTPRKTEEELKKEKELEDKAGCIICMFIFLIFAFFMVLFIRDMSKQQEEENKRHTQIFATKAGSLRLFVDGEATISINGTQRAPIGYRWPEYRVELPLYNISWSDGIIRHNDILFNIHSKGQESQTKMLRDASVCQEDGTQCFTFTTRREITDPIIVEYTVIYEISHPIRNQERKNLLYFNRTFVVDQWEIRH